MPSDREDDKCKIGGKDKTYSKRDAREVHDSAAVLRMIGVERENDSSSDSCQADHEQQASDGSRQIAGHEFEEVRPYG